ncbi:hypothetical protein RHMOL_Rhmol01G0062200 [Rhododendron molle]|uniref:Uncharacterized protein n=1 Tax=Rhododendron molle TaxID=49168 RepID=A0ACC0PZ54_RHOML|nr:hypothetical protein RHMOL_Rhmol01G0062200 [Rhododendron molle]
MANSLCSTPLTSIKVPSQPGLIVGNSAARKVIWINDTTRYCKTVKLQSFQAKVLYCVQNVKVLESIPKINVMDNLKLADYAGCAEASETFCAGIVMELALWVDS